jgi:hypothetical protein
MSRFVIVVLLTMYLSAVYASPTLGGIAPGVDGTSNLPTSTVAPFGPSFLRRLLVSDDKSHALNLSESL